MAHRVGSYSSSRKASTSSVSRTSHSTRLPSAYEDVHLLKDILNLRRSAVNLLAGRSWIAASRGREGRAGSRQLQARGERGWLASVVTDFVYDIHVSSDSVPAGEGRAGKDAGGPGPSRSSGSDAVASGRPGPGQLQSRAGAREQGQDVADGGFLAGGFGQRKARLDLVAVAAAVFLLRHVAGCGQVGDDAVSAVLGATRAGPRCRGTAGPGRGRRAAATGRGWSGHSSSSP